MYLALAIGGEEWGRGGFAPPHINCLLVSLYRCLRRILKTVRTYALSNPRLQPGKIPRHLSG